MDLRRDLHEERQRANDYQDTIARLRADRDSLAAEVECNKANHESALDLLEQERAEATRLRAERDEARAALTDARAAIRALAGVLAGYRGYLIIHHFACRDIDAVAALPAVRAAIAEEPRP